MNKYRVAILVALLAVLLTVPNAFGQLGTTDNASFIVQNLGTGTATVSITFYDAAGTPSTPSPLNAGKSNPFTLASGESFEVYLPGIAGLADGRYSVVISSNAPVVAIANLIGAEDSATFYNGSYSGASQGATIVYLPSVVHEYYNWNSLVSVQNIGSGPTNITVDYYSGPTKVATDTATGVPANASAHFDLETAAPSGLPTGFNGSAIITSSAQPVVATDNQTADGGFTQSYNGFISGATTLYVPGLYDGYYTWDASLNIQNVGSASATVTVDYSDSVANEVYTLGPKQSVLIYMPNQPAHAARFAATITSTQDIVAVVNAANPASQAQTYNAFSGGSTTVGLPTVMNAYYGWDTSFTVQNLHATASTVVHVCYDGVGCYNLPSLAAGASTEVYQPAETSVSLPSGYQGGVTLTSSGSVPIAAIVNETNGSGQAAGTGDWSMSYNGFNQ